MRLILITQDFPPDFGGIQTYCFEYAKRLSALCDDFALIAPEKPDSELIDREFDFPVYRIKLANNSNLVFSLFRKLEPIVRKHNSDATFHAQWQTAWPAIRLRRAGKLKKVFCSGHGRELIFNPYKKIPLLDPLYEYLRKKCLQNVDHNYPVSDYNSGMMGGLGVKKENRTVVINGTTFDVFHPIEADGLKNDLNLSDKKIIITVTRVIYRKGVDLVIRAVHKLKDKIPEICYVVIGDGPELENCKNLAKELNVEENVRFLGRIPYDDINPYYNMSDLFVMVPRSSETEVEGFGIVYLEANACRKPVIGSRSAGIPSAVLHGETGLLVEEENIEDLTSAIDKILTDENFASQLGNNGYERVKKQANWDALSRLLYNEMKSRLIHSNNDKK
ncbi:MAG: glycosyltransferase family 4 protein [Balneolaceae bacterium]